MAEEQLLTWRYPTVCPVSIHGVSVPCLPPLPLAAEA